MPNGVHVPIFEGQSKEEATNSFVAQKQAANIAPKSMSEIRAVINKDKKNFSVPVKPGQLRKIIYEAVSEDDEKGTEISFNTKYGKVSAIKTGKDRWKYNAPAVGTRQNGLGADYNKHVDTGDLKYDINWVSFYMKEPTVLSKKTP